MMDETLQAFMDFQKDILARFDQTQQDIIEANKELAYELSVLNTTTVSQTDLDKIINRSRATQKQLIAQYAKLTQDLVKNYNKVRGDLERQAKAAFDDLSTKLNSLAGPVAINNLVDTLQGQLNTAYAQLEETLVTSSDEILVAFTETKAEIQAQLDAIKPGEPTEPETPETPDTPTDPVDPNEPGEGGEGGQDNPTDPVDPENPTDPVDPENPTDPDNPGENEPTDPVDPVDPENPENPGEGGNDNPEPTDLGDIEGGNGNEMDPTLTEGESGDEGGNNDLDPQDPLVDPAP